MEGYYYGPCESCPNFDACYARLACQKGIMPGVGEQQFIRRLCETLKLEQPLTPDHMSKARALWGLGFSLPRAVDWFKGYLGK